MKIILTAFQEKLRSELMEWPENQQPRIKLLMDLDTLKMPRTDFQAAVFDSTEFLVNLLQAVSLQY